MSCVGFGVSARLGGRELPVNIESVSIEIESAHGRCPQTGDMFLAKEIKGTVVLAH